MSVSDWSSDVCSSDLSRRERRVAAALPSAAAGRVFHAGAGSKPPRTNTRAERAGGGVVRSRTKNVNSVRRIFNAQLAEGGVEQIFRRRFAGIFVRGNLSRSDPGN